MKKIGLVGLTAIVLVMFAINPVSAWGNDASEYYVIVKAYDGDGDYLGTYTISALVFNEAYIKTSGGWTEFVKIIGRSPPYFTIEIGRVYIKWFAGYVCSWMGYDIPPGEYVVPIAISRYGYNEM